MEPNSPRKIQFTVPLLEPHLDPEAAEQIRRRRPTPATLVLSSDQSSPEVDEDRVPNPLLKSGTSMSPRQRKKVSRTTPTMKELQMMVEHHLCKQQQEEEEEPGAKNQEQSSPACCPQGDTDHSHSPGGTCPLSPGLARLGAQGGGPVAPEGKKLSDAAGARSQATTRQDQATEPPGSPAPLTGSIGQKVPTAE